MDSELLPIIDFTKVKKKKKQEKEAKEVKLSQKAHVEDLSNINLQKKKITTGENEQKTKTDEAEILKEEYSYDELLNRVVDLIKNHNPELSAERASLRMPTPNVVAAGKLRTVWTNFSIYPEALNRPEEHLLSYIKGELCCDATIGGEKQLGLKAKVNKSDIQKLLNKYTSEYVKCPNCESYNTIIKKDQATRLQQLYCESCKAVKTIQNLKPATKGAKK